MWEGLVKTPLGSYTLRKFVVFLAAVLVAVFGYSLVSSTSVFAADATWKDDTIVYQSNAFRGPEDVSATVSKNLGFGDKKGTAYVFTPSGTPKKIFILFFSSGVDPPKADKAVYQEFEGGTIAQAANPTGKKTITLTPQEEPAIDTSADAGGTTSCAVEGIGWLICPITNFLAKGMDTVYSLVDGFLEVRPLASSTDQPMYRVWSYFLNLANVLFMIAVLVMVYAQITGGLMSNYTIKKILPRVIVAAIMVNLSYWICALAIDIANVLGYSVQDMFIALRNSLVGSEGNSWDVISWESFASLVLSGGSLVGGGGIAAYLGITAAGLSIAGGGAIAGLIFLVLPLLLAVLFVILMTFLILAARQAIITILVILAPIAIVAYLLPNTEEWFTRWRKAFITLLLVFPAFSVVFGGSQLAAAIIIQNATSLNIILLGMAVQVVPLAITPLLLKLGGGILNRFAGIVNNPTKGIFDRSKAWARDRNETNQVAGRAALAERAKRMGYQGSRPTSGQPGMRGRLANTRMRLNPYNMAYAREYNRREREGMKAENENVAAALYTQTTSGSRVYNRAQDAAIQKHLGEAHNHESFQRGMHAGSVGIAGVTRSHDHHQAHLAKGRGDVYENALTQHAERDLQTQINDPTGPLRGIKIHADVDASHAKFQTEQVESAGKRAYALEFEGSGAAAKALRQQRYQTIENNKVAETVDAMLNARGEERFNRITTDTTDINFNQNLKGLRLEASEASDSHKKAEASWNQLLEDVRLNGAGSANITTQADRVTAGRMQRHVEETVAAEKAAEKLKSAAQSRAQTAFLESTEGKVFTRQAQAAEDSLEAAKAEDAAATQEWRTKEGAEGLTGDDALIAQELQDADTQKRAQTQRAAAAKSTADQEYAGKVTDDEIIPGGSETIAEVAGGIAGAAGVSQAKATATQVTFKAFGEAVSAEKTLVSRNTPSEVLEAEITNPSDPTKKTPGLGSPDILDEPEGRIAALAGKVASGSHHASHIKLWERMGELRRQADGELVAATASGDQAAIDRAKDRVGKVKSLEQQVMDDKTKIPFGVGDTDMGAANVGDYAGNIYESTRARINTHMSAANLAKMDPDDIRLIFEMARAGKLSDAEINKVKSAYDEWGNDDNLKSSIQDKHRFLLEPFAQYSGGGDISSFPQPGSQPPAGITHPNFWNGNFNDGINSMSNPS